ncbi:MAG TPA: hypothetical protein VM638_05120 [Actinomycetota bacterium]|nr:hypothetical protein [Actinomycetota bacterium]
MAVDERRRKALHDALERRIGSEEAATLMEMLPPVGWADVATKHDLHQLELRLEARIEGGLAGVRGELGSAIERMGRRIVMWTAVMLVGLAGVVLTAARLS